jgi:hypothetical protein
VHSTFDIPAGKEHEQLQEYDDDLLAHVDHIHDPAVLKRLLIQKEQERQGLSLNLDMAARLGLDLHQQLQRCEIESAAKVFIYYSCNPLGDGGGRLISGQLQ